MKTAIYIIALLMIVLPKHSAAVDDGVKISQQELDVPQSAAFALLGVTPEKVIDPQTGQEFAAALLNGLDENGNLQSGLAIDFRPYRALGGKAFINDSYTSAIYSHLDRLKISLATTKGNNSADEAVRYGFGLNYAYSWDDFSSIATSNKDFQSCSQKAIVKLEIAKNESNKNPQTALGTYRDDPNYVKARDLFKSEQQVCYDNHSSWAKSSISFGAALQSARERSEDVRESGHGLWLTYSQALKIVQANSADSEVAIHARAVRGQLSLVSDTLLTSNNDLIALRFRGGSSGFRIIGETSYNREETEAENDSYVLWSLGAEKKIFNGVWFRIAYGDSIGARDKPETFSGQIRYAFGRAPTLDFVEPNS